MNNILVVGSNGQLGIKIKDNIPSKIKHNFIFLSHQEFDITDKESCEKYVKEMKCGVIINCAAYTNVDSAQDESQKAYKINAEGVDNLAKICKDNDIVLISVSTDYVFNGTSNTPYTPYSECNPISVYGSSKLQGEENIKKSGCKHIIIRTSWLYSDTTRKNFVKTMVDKLYKDDNIKVVYDQVGSPTNANDLAKFIVSLVEDETKLKQYGVYHYANKGVASWYDIVMAIAEYMDNNGYISGKYNVVPCLSSEFTSKVKRPNYSVLDTSKTEQTFGENIPYWRASLNEVLNNILSFYPKF